MKHLRIIPIFFLYILLILPVHVYAQKYEWKEASSAGYTYRYVTNDPTQTRFYTFKNGLQFIATVNKKEPRIQTLIAVRAGSNTDPRTNTGLAHYLEHLLFKGTDKYGSLDWSKEKPLLDQIELLYEKYNSTRDESQRKEIYKDIDRISGEAAKYAIAGEYAKMMKAMGGQASNAHTWYDETVYEDDIPTSSIDKFLALQTERFRNPVFRIFHTELEAVYEEKNRTLDSDGNKAFFSYMESLFPTHNYGQQTTIGTVEHLKNPSLREIRKYYEKYYVPNNMALIFAGDFNPDEVVAKVEATFAYMKPKAFEEYNPAPEAPLTGTVYKHVYGPAPENVTIAFRVPGVKDKDNILATVLDELLTNGKAGLIDLNVNKQQRTLFATTLLSDYKDYGIAKLIGAPKTGQSLEEVRDILLGQLELIKKGEFDESLIQAISNKFKINDIQSFETNLDRANQLMNSFIQTKSENWKDRISEPGDIAKVTKKAIVEFANKYYQNYVVVYKHKGEDKSLVKVEKPTITPVETNPNAQSDFVSRINKMPSVPVFPQWMDFDKSIKKGTVGSADLLYVQNKDNDLFRLYYRFDMGNLNNKLLPIAASYVEFLGTDKYSAEQISTEFFKLGSNFYVNTSDDITTVTLTGLKENLEKSAALFEQVIRQCKPDENAWKELKVRLQKARADSKLSRPAIKSALSSYAQYGSKNPFNNVLTNAELESIKPENLTALLHDLFNFEHTIIFYGPQTAEEFSGKTKQFHTLPASFKVYPSPVQFSTVKLQKSQVLLVDYDMVQAEISWARNPEMYAPKYSPVIELYNKYFSASVVYPTIRESKALAYSTYAYIFTPDSKDKPYTMFAYVGTQADKINLAIPAMDELLNELPLSEKSFNSAKENLKNEIETERVIQDGIIFSYLSAKRRGLDSDIRKTTYEALDKLTLNDLKQLHNEWMSHKPFTYNILASEKKINLEELGKYGELKKISLEELFGY